ncbi:MAG: hypothetical protein K9J81_07350, partial [Desulfohalobiaceae bacterium]|nr:hypothetical protein [Desulfohalobiaceae bacterium]
FADFAFPDTRHLKPETKSMSNFKNISDIIHYFRTLRFNGVMSVRGLYFMPHVEVSGVWFQVSAPAAGWTDQPV